MIAQKMMTIYILFKLNPNHYILIQLDFFMKFHH